MKICTKCKIEKQLFEFHKDLSKKDGFASSCKNCRSIVTHNYNLNNKSKANKYCEKYYLKNKEQIKNYKQCWYQNNKNDIRYQQNQYKNNRYHKDIHYHILVLLRSRILTALKNNSKSRKTLDLLGCSIKELKQHLQSQFTIGMNWNNHTVHGWHIDHKKPCAKFDLSRESEQRKCFHYTNLQPLWAIENLIKSDK